MENILEVFIYGSCVTRDAVEWFEDFGLEMTGYVARQSLISSFAPAKLSEYDLSVIKSSFQRKMATGDISSNLMSQIETCNPDVILWDLCDERLNVVKAPTGGVVTWSRDYKKERSHVATGRFIGPIRHGTDDHFVMWSAALQKFLGSLEALGIRNRLVLNATPWAIQDENGDEGASAGAVDFNQKNERYIDLITAEGVNVISASQDATMARTDHKWGAAPFHYVDQTYKSMLTELVHLSR